MKLNMKPHMKRFLISTVLVLAASIVVYSQARGTPNTLRVRVDATGALLASSAAQVAPINQGTFSTRVLATDANGNLLIALSGGTVSGTTTFTGPIILPQGSAANPSIGFTGDVNTGIFSPGDGLVRILENGVARLTTGSSAVNINGSFLLDANTVMAITEPSAPVACTSPSVVTGNGTVAFRISVGTGCATSTLSWTMPGGATTGWQCNGFNIDRPTASFPHQTNTTTTVVTMQNFNAAHAATNWTDADDVVISCLAF